MAHPVLRGGVNISWDLLLSKSWLRWGLGLDWDGSEMVELKVLKDASSRIKMSEFRTTNLKH